jgi:hypothetical protein
VRPAPSQPTVSVAPSANTFDRWVGGTGPAVFFVDAVDEVYLRQRKFGDVTRALASDAYFGTREVQLVATARNGGWT